jgi:hypothetical protein
VGIAFVALAGAAGEAAARSGRVVMRDGLQYKPHELAITGDGDYLVQSLQWQSWGGKQAIASGRAVEQQRPSHVDHTYPVRVTLSDRTYCANIRRIVYNKISARILGPNPGVFGERTAGRVYTCAGEWRLTSSASGGGTGKHGGAGQGCSTGGMRPEVRTITARGTSCVGARKVVAEWRHRAKRGQCVWQDGSTQPGVCTIQAWRCTADHTVNGQTFPVVCTASAPSRQVRFVLLV